MATAVEYMKTTGLIVLAVMGLFAVVSGQWNWTAFIVGIALFGAGVLLQNVDVGESIYVHNIADKTVTVKKKPTQPSKNSRRMKYLIAGFIVGFIIIQILLALLPKPVTLEYGSQVTEVKPVAPAPEPVQEVPSEIGMMNETSGYAAARTIADLMPTMVIVVVFAVVIGVILQVMGAMRG